MFQHAPTTIPTHSIKRIGMSKNYGSSILQHVETCDANKPLHSMMEGLCQITWGAFQLYP